jgi:flagellar biosynthesis protein FlhG
MRDLDMVKEHVDQADTLRSLSGNFARPSLAGGEGRKFPQVISVTSGKGGVGKTAVAANVAIVLARLGKKVLIIDADLGLANIDVVFNLAPQYNLNHFFAGEKSLQEIVIEGPEGIHILPAGSGIQSVTQLSSDQKLRFLDAMDDFHGDFDIIIIDTEAGISENVTYFNVAAQEILVVTTPDPTAITDAYAIMKLLSTKYHERRFNLIVNSVADQDEALDVYKKLTLVSNRYLDISIDYLGCIPYDKRMREAISKQTVMVELYPKSKISGAFEDLAENLTSVLQNVQPKGTPQFFWKRLLAFGQSE